MVITLAQEAGASTPQEVLPQLWQRLDALAHPDKLVEVLSQLSMVWAGVFVATGLICLLQGYRVYKGAVLLLALGLGGVVGYQLGLSIKAEVIVAGCLAVLLAVVVVVQALFDQRLELFPAPALGGCYPRPLPAHGKRMEIGRRVRASVRLDHPGPQPPLSDPHLHITVNRHLRIHIGQGQGPQEMLLTDGHLRALAVELPIGHRGAAGHHPDLLLPLEYGVASASNAPLC